RYLYSRSAKDSGKDKGFSPWNMFTRPHIVLSWLAWSGPPHAYQGLAPADAGGRPCNMFTRQHASFRSVASVPGPPRCFANAHALR
ncbi:MAG TPA: hypothetical protein VGY53_04840, partial [Isosphaeraceae bacterium]|nr:hypothetical protein [Isosphaeraceae bacterium]